MRSRICFMVWVMGVWKDRRQSMRIYQTQQAAPTRVSTKCSFGGRGREYGESRPQGVIGAPHLRHNPATLNNLLSSCFSSSTSPIRTRLSPEHQWFLVFYYNVFNTSGRYFLTPRRWQQPQLPLPISPIAHMSTGVDQPLPTHSFDPNPGARQRSISKSNGSAFLGSVESGRAYDKQNVTMAQNQKSRYLKTGAIIAFIFMLILWMSPSKSAASAVNQGMCRSREEMCRHKKLIVSPCRRKSALGRRWINKVHKAS